LGRGELERFFRIDRYQQHDQRKGDVEREQKIEQERGSGRIIMASTMKTSSGTASARQGTARRSGWLKAAASEFNLIFRVKRAQISPPLQGEGEGGDGW